VFVDALALVRRGSSVPTMWLASDPCETGRNPRATLPSVPVQAMTPVPPGVTVQMSVWVMVTVPVNVFVPPYGVATP